MIKTKTELKHALISKGSKFFEPNAMKFFGDTMANYGFRVLKKFNVYELYRKRPNGRGYTKSAYFDIHTFKRVNLDDQQEIITRAINSNSVEAYITGAKENE